LNLAVSGNDVIGINGDKRSSFGPKAIMKKISEKSQCFLIVLFSFLFLVLPAYLYLSTLDDLEIASPYCYFKNIDQEDSILSSEKEKIFKLTFFIECTYIVLPSSSWGLNLFSKLPASLNPKPLVLRC
jgi:hypothetical protein